MCERGDDGQERSLGDGVHAWREYISRRWAIVTDPVKPFVSIVVPLLNEEATIERLARSLLEQTIPATATRS